MKSLWVGARGEHPLAPLAAMGFHPHELGFLWLNSAHEERSLGSVLQLTASSVESMSAAESRWK